MRNWHVDLWRFLFSIYILIYHYFGHYVSIKTGGYIAVDFFLVLTGYYMALQIKKNPNKIGYGHGLHYIKSRVIRLYPAYIFAYLICIIVKVYTGGLSFRETISLVCRSFPEMFMLRIGSNGIINGVTWYVAAMFIAGLLVWGLLIYQKGFYSQYLAPISALVIYYLFYNITGRIHHTSSSYIIPGLYDGLLRAFAGISLGVFASEISEGLKKRLAGASQKTTSFLIIIGHILICTAFIFSFKYNRNLFDFIWVFLFFFGIILLNAYISTKTNKLYKIPIFLGELSYASVNKSSQKPSVTPQCLSCHSPLLLDQCDLL